MSRSTSWTEGANGHRSYPFQESLLTFADDRGHDDLA